MVKRKTKIAKVITSIFTCISEGKLQFPPTWFVEIRFPFYHFLIGNRRNQQGTLLILLMDVEAVILITVELNLVLLNQRKLFLSECCGLPDHQACISILYRMLHQNDPLF